MQLHNNDVIYLFYAYENYVMRAYIYIVKEWIKFSQINLVGSHNITYNYYNARKYVRSAHMTYILKYI